LILLLSSTVLPWIELLFPLWVLLVSVHVLSMSLRRQTVEQEAHPEENQSTQMEDTADAESAPG
jgi:cytochrome c-type biogenesis protein CcmH/NrfF